MARKNNIAAKNQNDEGISLTDIDFDKFFKKENKLNHIPINKLYKERGNNLVLPGSSIKEEEGMYIFWWNGDLDVFNDKTYILKGPSGIEKKILITNKWVKKATVGKTICLYVGKSSTLHQRIGQHIKIKNKNRLYKKNEPTTRKPNTESQLRYGLERLFPSEENSLKIILENVSVSILGKEHTANAIDRFYFEDYLIGKLKPLLNLDIER